MSNRSCLVGKSLNLLVVVSVLLAAVPLSASAGGVPAAVEDVAPAASDPLPVPAADPAPRTEPALALSVFADPEGAAPGDIITFSVVLSNTGDAPLGALGVAAELPAGLLWIPDQSGWTYDAAAKRAGANVEELAPGMGAALTLQLRAAGPVDQAAVLAIAVTDDGMLLAQAEAAVWVANPGRATVGLQGGRLRSPDGRVQVDFPAGSMNGPVEATVILENVQRYDATQGDQAEVRFSLTPDMTFETPVTLTVDLAGLGDWDSLPPEREVVLVTWDDEAGTWVEIPSRFDPARGVLTAQLAHFSEYGTGTMEVAGWRLLFHPVQPSLFSGAATYAYPIDLPPGPGGLQPGVTLSYNSRAVDGIIGWAQSDWIGLGWSADQIDITRMVDRTSGEPYLYQYATALEQVCDYNERCHVNEFNLLFNGASYHLRPVDGLQKGGRYYAEGMPSLWVYRHNDTTGDPSPVGTNVTGEWWEIRTTDGTTYRLGYTYNSEQTADNVYSYSEKAKNEGALSWYPWDYEWLYAGRAKGLGTALGTVAYRWRVDRVTDVHGNAVNYTYAEEDWRDQCGGASPTNFNRASYLSTIQYGDVTVTFVRGRRGTDDTIADGQGASGACKRSRFFQYYYLSKIQVHVAGNLQREYRMVYASSGDGRDIPTRILQSIQLYERNGASLPATTFGYAWMNNQDHLCNWADGCTPDVDGRDQFLYPRLNSVNNGYGGIISLQYVMGRSKYAHYYYSLSRMTVSPGIGVSGVTTYSYSEPCYRNGSHYWEHGCKLVGPHSAGPFGGWRKATEQYLGDDGSTVVTRVEHMFYTANEAGTDHLLGGREVQTRVLDGSGSLLQQVDRVWNLDSASGGWARLDEERQTSYSNGSSSSTKKLYKYETASQGGAQYGMLTRIEEYDEHDVRKRITSYGYAVNPTKWIIVRWAESVFDGNWSLQASALSLYDGNMDPDGQVLDKGLLTLRRVRLVTPGQGCPTTDQTVDVSYTYGARGNLETTTTYAGYGQVQCIPGDWTAWSPPGSGSQGTTATVTYDQIYHQFPVEACSAVGTPLEMCAQTRYYGVNGSTASGSFVVGQEPAASGGQFVYVPNGGGNRMEVPDEGQKVTFTFPGVPAGEYRIKAWVYSLDGNDDSFWVKVDGSPAGGYLWDTLLNTGYQEDYVNNRGVADPVVVNLSAGTHTVAVYLREDGARLDRIALEPVNGSPALVREAESGEGLFTGLFGQVEAVVDANGAVTEYRYDTFGRLLSVKAPDDPGWGNDQVSTRLVYVNMGQVGKQRINTWSGRGAMWQEEYFDGLGRTIQVHQMAEGGQEVRTTTQYDALGRAVKQWAPSFGTHGEDGGYGTWGYVAPGAGLPYTLTQYDALGRAVRVVNADGTSGRAVYGVQMQIGEDANRHVGLSYNDAFGQLAAVDETLVKWGDAFEDSVLTGWTSGGTVSEAGGVVQITGNTTDWNTYIGRDQSTLENGQGVVFDFKCNPTASGTVNMNAFLSRGIWQDAQFRRWGIDMDSTTIYLHAYEGSTSRLIPLLALRTGVWYRALLRVGDDGEFIVAVWERDNPAVGSVRREVKTWSALDWVFAAYVMNGTLALDNYDELTFHTTEYAYDILSHLTVVTDTVGNVTTMQYDSLGRKTWMSDPDMGVWQYGYDTAGNLTWQEDAQGQVLSFEYDALNRLLRKCESVVAGSCAGGQTLAEYGYDEAGHGAGLGRRTSMATPGVGTASWTYDIRGRVISETRTIDGAPEPFTTSSTYNALDQVVTMTYPDGEVVTQTYDGRWLPQSLSSSLGETFVQDAAYNAMGQLTNLQLGNTVTTEYSYHALNFRLERIQVGEWMNLEYAYDPAGNVTRIGDGVSEEISWPASGFTFEDGFDANGSLTFQDTFNSKNTADWIWNSYQTVPYNDGGNNVVRNAGTGSSYDGNFRRSVYSLSDGKGLQFRFKVDQTDTGAHFSIEANDATYRRFGVIAGSGKVYVQYNDGTGWYYPADLITSVQVNTWYVGRIVVDDDGGFSVEVYQESNPAVRGRYSGPMPAGKTWRFRSWIFRGTGYVDDYQEFLYDAPDAPWTWSSLQRVPFNDGGNNVVKSIGTGANYDANFYRGSYSLTSGEGLQVRFRVDGTETYAHFSVESTSARFGVLARYGKLQVQYNDGTSGYQYPVDLIANLELNTWYVLRVVVDDLNGFYVEVYQESNPSVRGSYRMSMPAGQAWRFHHWIYRGNAMLDDYREFDAADIDWGKQWQYFEYDSLDRLTHAWTSVEGNGVYDRGYTYDPIGNILSKTGVGDYTYEGNGYAHTQPHAVTHIDGVQRYWYDENGNQTQRAVSGTQVITYVQEFNIENRLTVVTDTATGEVTYFIYDGDGNRVLKQDSSGTTIYIGGYYEEFIPQEMTIGEVGFIDDALTHAPQTVLFSRHYRKPVVFAQPLSRDGETAVVRITDVQADRFTLYVDEAPDRDGSHTTESVSWLVMEAGSWELAGGARLEVGMLVTTATVGSNIPGGEWAHVDLSSALTGTPVVMSQVQTNNDPSWVKTRQQNVGVSGFDVAMEREEAASTAHGSETVGWLAIEAGQGSWSGHAYEAAHTADAVGSSWYQITFGQAFGQAPRFLGALETYDESDSAHLRYSRTYLTASVVQVRAEEDTTYDSETTHTTEVVGYLALEGDGLLTAKMYAPVGSLVTKYYAFGGARVAMRVSDGVTNTVTYLHGDHLGSTSLATTDTGGFVSRVLYYPYGETRYEEGTLPTDFGFTGQRNARTIKLLDYHARWYDSLTGRFISPDTIVPDPANPQSLNRYAYVYNRPLGFVDPSGHCPGCPSEAEARGYCSCTSSAPSGFEATLSADYHDKSKWSSSYLAFYSWGSHDERMALIAGLTRQLENPTISHMQPTEQVMTVMQQGGFLMLQRLVGFVPNDFVKHFVPAFGYRGTTVEGITSANCWEMDLLVLITEGVLPEMEIRRAYGSFTRGPMGQVDGTSAFVRNVMGSNCARPLSQGRPQPGEFVFFNHEGHVAVYEGLEVDEHGVSYNTLTLWPTDTVERMSTAAIERDIEWGATPINVTTGPLPRSWWSY